MDYSYYLLNVSCVPGTVLDAVYVLTHLILTIILEVLYIYIIFSPLLQFYSWENWSHGKHLGYHSNIHFWLRSSFSEESPLCVCTPPRAICYLLQGRYPQPSAGSSSEEWGSAGWWANHGEWSWGKSADGFQERCPCSWERTQRRDFF